MEREIRVAKLEERAHLPTRKHKGDAGMDFYCMYDVIIPPHSFKIVKTGITVEIPKDLNAILKPKGSSNFLVGAGVIENTYQGEVMFKLFNPTERRIAIKKGNSCGQMIFIPAVSPKPIYSESYEIHNSKTTRAGSGGIVRQINKE